MAPTTPQNRSNYPGPQPPPTMTRPAVLAMQCHPRGGKTYSVVVSNGHAAVISPSGVPREYSIVDTHDDDVAGVFYLAMKRGDQSRTVYTAFDYAKDGDSDHSALRVKAPPTPQQPQGYDASDSCAMDWENSK